MTERRPFSQMVVIALFSALIYGGSNRQPTAAPGSSSTESKAQAKQNRKNDAAPKSSFTGGQNLLAASCGANWVEAIRNGRCGCGLKTLVVTLPDPYGSHLDWSYDADLEAVRRAVEATDYVIDRYALPVADTSQAGRALEEPSVMLYRPRSWNAKPLLLVYVVGESPTAGIHKHAMTAALTERARLLASLDQTEKEIRVVGPTFSGSVPSLIVALNAYHNASGTNGPISVATGSATDPGIKDLLTNNVSNLAFFSTINNDAALDRVRDNIVLPLLLRKGDAVAMLTESGTAYGAKNLKAGYIGGTDSIRVITVPFPLNIADMRAGYHRDEQPEPDKKLPGATSGENVNLNINSKTRSPETPPTMSDVTPASVDAMMHEILSTLRRNRVRAVVLHATDVRDKLFLARVIRQELKDVQLVTYESNALYGRNEFNRTLRGMVVLSSYPLVLENQDWTDRQRSTQRMAFPSETAEGIYNAVLLQIDGSSDVLEYGGVSMAEWDNTAPPVWITAVGAHSLLPITNVPNMRNATRLGLGRPEPEDDYHDLGFVWTGLALLVMIVASFMALRTIALTWEEWRRERCEWREAIGRQQVPELYPDIHAVLSLFAVIILVAPLVVVLRGYTAPTMSSWIMRGVAFSIALWVQALLVMFYPVLRTKGKAFTEAFSYINDHIRYGKVERVVEIPSRILLLIFGVVALFVTGQFVKDIIDLNDVGFDLFAYRALQMDSGLSALLPVMLGAAGLLAWCIWHTQRVRELREGTAAEEMLLTNDKLGLTVLQKFAAEFRRRLVLVWPLRAFAIPAVILAFSGIGILWYGRGSLEWLLFPRRYVPVGFSGEKLDYVAFDVLFKGALISLLCAVTWALLRLLACWASLQRFLAGIAECKLVWSLSELPLAMRKSVRASLITINSQQPLGRIANQQWAMLGTATRNVTALKRHRVEFDDLERNLDFDQWWSLKKVTAIDLAGRLERIQDLLVKLWQEDRRVLTLSPDKPNDHATYRAYNHGKRVNEWRTAAEQFVTGQMIYYVDWAQAQLRRISYFILVSLLLGIALVSSYPFQPQSVVRALLALVIALAMGAIIYVTSQMNRDPVLSTLSGTEAGVVNWNSDFILNIVLYVVVPVLTLLSSEIPIVRSVVFSWAEPLFRSLVKF